MPRRHKRSPQKNLNDVVWNRTLKRLRADLIVEQNQTTNKESQGTEKATKKDWE